MQNRKVIGMDTESEKHSRLREQVRDRERGR